jgi:GT2 family glycosyltransferase
VFDQRSTVRQEVIVVDNASTDRTVEVIREKFPAVRLLVPGRNLGFAAANNLAARQTEADYILLLNPDTIILNHAIDVIVDFARANPDYGVYGGRTLKPNRSLEPSSCWGLPSLWSLAMFASGLSSLVHRNRLLDPESLGRWPRDTVREVGVITGCLLLADRAAWKKLGGLDERYFMYGEDTDFSMRAKRAGYHPVICPGASIVHEVGQSSATPIHKLLMLYRGKACFFRTHYSGAWLQLALLFLVAGVGLRCVLSRIRPAKTRGEFSNDWPTLWQARHEWLPGYPAKK